MGWEAGQGGVGQGGVGGREVAKITPRDTP